MSSNALASDSRVSFPWHRIRLRQRSLPGEEGLGAIIDRTNKSYDFDWVFREDSNQRAIFKTTDHAPPPRDSGTLSHPMSTLDWGGFVFSAPGNFGFFSRIPSGGGRGVPPRCRRWRTCSRDTAGR